MTSDHSDVLSKQFGAVRECDHGLAAVLDSGLTSLSELCSEWIKMVQCVLVLVSVSVEDERLFSAYNFVRNKLRKAPSTNLEVCVRVKTQTNGSRSTFSHIVHSRFPPHILWEKSCHTRFSQRAQRAKQAK